jgi:uncharacterized protein
MSMALKLLLLAALLYAGYVILLLLMQTSLLFPRYLIQKYDLPPPPESTRTYLDTSSGRVEAWYLPPDDPGPGPAPVVIFGHGNAELIDFWPEDLGRFRRMGLGVLLIEYPGYGRSEGTPSERTIVEAFTAGYDWLTLREDVDTERIILFGRSMGGGAVCALARERPSAGLILMSTFTSISSMASRYLVPTPLLSTRFDNLATVRAYDRPILIIHGTRDTIVPFDHALELHRAAPDSRLLAFECGHNDCPTSGPEFQKEIELFLERLVSRPAPQ